MTVKLLIEHHLEFLSLKGGCTGSFELHLSKCHIVGNHMAWLKYVIVTFSLQQIAVMLIRLSCWLVCVCIIRIQHKQIFS